MDKKHIIKISKFYVGDFTVCSEKPLTDFVDWIELYSDIECATQYSFDIACKIASLIDGVVEEVNNE